MEKYVEEILKYLEAQEQAEKKGEHDFICSLCGGTAHWSRAKSNNHLHMSCDKCGMVMME